MVPESVEEGQMASLKVTGCVQIVEIPTLHFAPLAICVNVVLPSPLSRQDMEVVLQLQHEHPLLFLRAHLQMVAGLVTHVVM
jgi:hypothetical protein